MEVTTYLNKTFNSKNPLVRFAHRRRYKANIASLDLKDGTRILDFGCGDAFFINMLLGSTSKNVNILGYEPYMTTINNNALKIVRHWQEVVEDCQINGKFNYIVCFEVMEHFTSIKQKELLKDISNVLSEDGVLIISVPIEKGFPAIIKNIIRRLNLNDNKTYNLKNMLASFFGKALTEYRDREGYLSHMGFYFNDLEKVLEQYFTIEKKFFSPFRMLGYQLNSQVFYILKITWPHQFN